MITLDARLTALSSRDLLAALERTAANGREVTADLIALLAECDARQLYAVEGYASLFEFCVARLRLSEAQAYHRIQAARAVRRFPLVLERLRDGRVSLTAVALLRERLTEANHREVLDWADGRRRREVEAFIRGLDPKPDVAVSIRRLPARHQAGPVPAAADDTARTRVPEPLGHGETESAQTVEGPLPLGPGVSAAAQASTTARHSCAGSISTPTGVLTVGTSAPHVAATVRSEIRALAPARYSLHVTISEETHDKLRRAQDLLRHVMPAADPALVLDRALTLLLAQLERRKAGAPPRPQRTRNRLAAPRSTHRLGAVAATGEAEDRRRPEGLDASSRDPVAGESQTPPIVVARADTRRAGTLRARSRYIPAEVRRAVWDREGGRCGYVSPTGVRCNATGLLEYHHRVPFAEGGASTTDNVVLTCQSHNALEARRWFDCDQAESASG